MPTIVDGQTEHIAQLLAKPLRQPNAEGWETSTGGKPLEETLQQLLPLSECVRAVLNPLGECISLFGITRYNGWANLWLIASEEAEPLLHDPAAWVEELDRLESRYGLIAAFTSVTDTLTLGWLDAVGFQRLEDIAPEGLECRRAVHIRGEASCAFLPLH